MSEPVRETPPGTPSGAASSAVRLAVALVLAFALAGAVLGALGPARSRARRPAATLGPEWNRTASTGTARAASTHRGAALSPVVPPPVVAAARSVPADVLRSSTAAASRPGLRLLRTRLGAWEARRAELEDTTTGDVRAYAIGDLLPRGALLVGISTGTADIMVADSELLRFHTDGHTERVQDLSYVATAPTFRPAAQADDPDLDDKIRLALIDARSDDPTVVQAAIDRMIAGGDSAVDVLINYVDSAVPVRSAQYAFPSGSDVQVRPAVLGQIVIAVLEQITGQKLGDANREGITQADRLVIADAWRRWWKGE